LILKTTQRMFYHAEQRNDLLNNGIGRHVFRPCSHWNWIPGQPGGDEWQQRMPSVERLLTILFYRKSTRPPSKNNFCLYTESVCPTMCYRCSAKYIIRAWDHGDLGVELSLETWTKLGSCRTTDEIWWLTAVHHTCDTYTPGFCKEMRLILPWQDTDTGAPRFDFLLKQSTPAVPDPSFVRAFKDLCIKSRFTDTSATVSGNFAVMPREWRWKAWKGLLQKMKLAAKR
jgi:hypothetical protein